MFRHFNQSVVFIVSSVHGIPSAVALRQIVV
jgi:hypothetical protein